MAQIFWGEWMGKESMNLCFQYLALGAREDDINIPGKLQYNLPACSAWRNKVFGVRGDRNSLELLTTLSYCPK